MNLYKNSFWLHKNSSKLHSDSSTHFSFLLIVRSTIPILHKAFSCANIYVKYSSHILLVSLWCLQYAFFHFVVILNNIVDFDGVFWSWYYCCVTRSAVSSVLVRLHLNQLIYWQMIVFGSVLYGVFVHQKAMFNKNTNYFWVYYFHKSKSSIIFLTAIHKGIAEISR